MPAQLIDGVALSQHIRAEVARRAAALTAAGRQPGQGIPLLHGRTLP
jgi:methylenetetrahydrofolate dehydrogenase (NADP+) / methenyltetrahydrofolate cyclohydrolase